MISVEEYLNTSYRPDCEYIDGKVQERNLGESDHSYLLGSLSTHLYARSVEFDIRVYISLRVRLKQDRIRVPDICVILGTCRASEQVLTGHPFCAPRSCRGTIV